MVAKNHNVLILILAIGIFSILNTEVGIIGILPLMAEKFGVDITQAGLLVSLFALIIAVAGIIMPLVFSGFNRKKVMLTVLTIFAVCNLVAAFAPNFTVVLIARLIPTFAHPVYCSLAFVVAASLVEPKDVPKAISKVMMGVSAGIVIGIPVTSFIANTFSYQTAMLFFTLMNIIALILTTVMIPSMPVKERVSYGSQLSVLKDSITWMSLFTVSAIGASLFAAYAYIAQYLEEISHITGDNLSLALFLFGYTSILGNFIAGRLLSSSPIKTAVMYPIIFSIVYLLIFVFGEYSIVMVPIIFFWGMLNGIGNNIQQYWIMSAIPEAPDFANGLFISFGNLGTTIGTFAGGMILAGMGTHYTVFGGIFFLVLTWISVLLRNIIYAKPQKAEEGQVGA
ncbi:MFS transporter [Megamonas hypermegale]|uniref:MFS transporter n=1 Tax=Megamonas hypermegale TaxID=158847 RepID=UPI0026F276BF|nr:MFS transporter [Megamonas hypermegale]